MTLPISVSITGSGDCFKVGWPTWDNWLYLWGQDDAWTLAKPAHSVSPRNDYEDSPLMSGMRRAILFFDTTGISQDIALRVNVTAAGWGGGQIYILNGNGADPDFGAEIFGWIRGRFSAPYLIVSKDITAMTVGYHYLLIPSAHVNSSGYTVLLVVHSSDYGMLGGPSATMAANWATSRLEESPAGYIWVEGTSLAYVDANCSKRLKEGATTGNTGTAGHIWNEGNYLHYIDSSGNERRIEGTQEGATGKTAGHFWIEGSNLRYIDSSGNERYFQGT